MNKPQKIIILIALALIFFSIIYPPCKILSIDSDGKEEMLTTRWDWMFNLGASRMSLGMVGDSMQYHTFNQKIRLDLLICEILAIGVLACFFIVLTKKTKK